MKYLCRKKIMLVLFSIAIMHLTSCEQLSDTEAKESIQEWLLAYSSSRNMSFKNSFELIEIEIYDRLLQDKNAKVKCRLQLTTKNEAQVTYVSFYRDAFPFFFGGRSSREYRRTRHGEQFCINVEFSMIQYESGWDTKNIRFVGHCDK